ncbi:MAG TPA: AAA family ATPase [Actinomycetota bacterium]|nr:AAA family ATPase [Actinomycetota bacterium]
MFLRSLRIRGFKSFADKSVLEFGPGVSVIVGPNGSGKSNIVDAISWVLGEQGPRALRGGQMADVIFAGAQDRTPLGMAEVTLVIDNEAGLIPIDAGEIEVSRTIFRSGESQYAIGGKPVRLMDILELLSDTGIGRGLHTVIGQGHLEDALTARPEDRRRFIEEAAGIAKHRRRKERAQRKLAGLDQDLLRLQDVMTELRRQLKPLKQQAQAAEKHETLSQEAEALAARMAAARLRELYRERDRRLPLWEEGQARRKEAEERLAELDTEISGLDRKVSESERALEDIEAAHQQALADRSTAEAALREAVRREGEARAKAAADEGRSGRLFTLEEEARRHEAALAETLSSVGEKEAALEHAERAFRSAEEARREAEDARRRAHEESAQRRAELEGLRRSLESAEAERGRIEASLAELAASMEKLGAERGQIEAEIERLDAQETPLARRQTELRRERERLAGELEHLADAERRLENRRQALDARRTALTQTSGSRFLKRAKHAIGMLGKLIEVDPGLERAVAAALGSMADAIVYEDHGRAVAEAGEAAGATLAVVEGASGGFRIMGERPLLSGVRADPRVEPLVRAALRDVYLAADEGEALAKHRRHPAASFVTRDGVLVGPAVVRTAPRPTEDELAVKREDSNVARDLTRVRSQVAGKRGRLDQVDGELAEVQEELERADALITAAAERMGNVGVELKALDRERALLQERGERVEETIRGAREAMNAMPRDDEGVPEIPPHPEAPVTLRVEVEALRRDRARLEAGLARARAELEELRGTDPETLREAAEARTAEREEAERALAEIEKRAREAGAAREEAGREAHEARASGTRTNEAWRAAAAELQRLRDEYEDEDQVRRDLERRIAESERVLRDGHGREPEGALGELAEDDTVESLQKRSDLVTRRLGLLGRVNLVATDEYRSLQERHDFLAREIEDVRTARRDLRHVVTDVDRKIEEIFGTAYRDVAAEFSAIIGTLFPGGEGKLSLTDPGDLLATGVEISARPGRKRVQRLSLLSGGERSLVALAFLFAIFRARPSPFYLLDEVEAALDDVNLHRFLDLVRDFARTSQVLVITHQKRTMEAADVLYGVSMSGGVTAVISQRISEATAADEVPADR